MSNIDQIIERNPVLNGISNPSILSIGRHPEKTSERYKTTDDLAVIQSLNDAGWIMDKYKQVKSREQGDRFYSPYLASYSHPNLQDFAGEGKLQILQRNAKDGTKRHEILVGFFRFACENGLVVGKDLFEPIRVKHIGNQPLQLESAVKRVTDKLPEVYDRIEAMKRFTLTDSQRESFARAAIAVRTGEEKKNSMKVEQILQVNRPSDNLSTLWNTFNVVQENLIRTPEGVEVITDKNKVRKARAITNIDATLKVNQGLWTLAEIFMGVNN